MDIFEYLEQYNKDVTEEYVKVETRIYYVMKDKDIVDCFKISKRHTLAEANKIAKEMLDILYNEDGYIVEYTGQIGHGSYVMADYTEGNEYFEHMTHIFVY